MVATAAAAYVAEASPAVLVGGAAGAAAIAGVWESVVMIILKGS